MYSSGPSVHFSVSSWLSCDHTLSALVSALVDAEKHSESIALHAFDSFLHEEIKFDFGSAGVDPCILTLLADMYKNLKVELKLPLLAKECTSLLYTSSVSPRGNPLPPLKKRVR